MNAEELGNSKILNFVLKPAGWAMESRLRRLFQDPVKILLGAGLRPGDRVLEVGSGTGFFTLAAARIIGEQGHLIAMEPLSSFVQRLRAKVEESGLGNIEVRQRDALDTGLDSKSIDNVLLLGVVPFPSLPLNRLLPEMHRVLKPDGTLSVWLFPVVGLVPKYIRRSGHFGSERKRSGVYTYRPVPPANA